MPIWKLAKTPFSTLKHDEQSHGVPGGSRLDYDIFEFENKCFQTIQPPMLFFIQSAVSVHNAMVFWFYLSNARLGWDECFSIG